MNILLCLLNYVVFRIYSQGHKYLDVDIVIFIVYHSILEQKLHMSSKGRLSALF